MRRTVGSILAATLAGVVACGGAGLSMPKPLTETIDEMHIARVPREQRPTVGAAQDEFNLAKSDRMTAETTLSDVNTEIEVAKNDAEKAGLEERSARTKAKDAASSADMNRKMNADREVRAAEIGAKAADAKVTYLKAKREYLKMQVRFTAFNTYAKEAKFEVEKAKVAKANSIQPPGFVFDLFEKQYKDRSEAAQRAKLDADNAKKKAEEKKKRWKEQEKEWYAAKGEKAPEEIKPLPDKPAPAPGDKGAAEVIR